MKIISEDFQFVLDAYPRETMTKLKQDYYERELSYQLLVQQERAADNLKLKAEVQVKLSRISKDLQQIRESFEEEREEESVKTRGKQQPGMLFD